MAKKQNPDRTKRKSAGQVHKGMGKQVSKRVASSASSILSKPSTKADRLSATRSLAVSAAGESRLLAARPIARPRYRMEIVWSDEDRAYVVTVPDLPGCMTHGTTYVDAARMGEEAIEAWLEGARHWGRPIPVPGVSRR